MDLSNLSNLSNQSLTNNTASTLAAAQSKSTTDTDLSDSKVTDTTNSTAAVYEKTTDANSTDSTKQIYSKDALVNKLKADQQSRIDTMQSLVEKLLNKQKDCFDLAKATNLSNTFELAAKVADPETIKQAQEDISEDGYWGVEQTSDRMVSMAIALSGGDTSKADLLLESIQKGYDKAADAWGKDLPQLCKDTLEATKQKMNDWKNGITTAADYTS